MAGAKGIKSYATGRTVTLVVLTGFDLVLGGIGMTAAIGAGWPDFSPLNGSAATAITGVLMSLFLAQCLLRLPILGLMAGWSFRLVSNAHRHQTFAISPRWAWLGWLLPVVSYWLPARMVLHLNMRLGVISAFRRLLIVAWWITRLLTCPTGVIASLFAFGIYRGVMYGGTSTSEGIGAWTAWVILIGVITQLLAAVIVILTYRNQPKGAAVTAAELF